MPARHTLPSHDPWTTAVLVEKTARTLADIPKEIKQRHISNCLKADPAYGKGVTEALGLSLFHVPQEEKKQAEFGSISPYKVR